MSKYDINDYGKIYSDFARRLGVIVKQYDSCQVEDEHNYESALHVCILQNLLTQFNSIREWATGRGKESFPVENVWDEELPFWDIELQNVEIPNEEHLKVGFILDEIRDILSHPFPVSNGMEYSSDSDLGKIISYRFISRDRQTGNIGFQVNLKSQQVKDLVAHLSNYLSDIAKEIMKEEVA